MNQSLFLDPSMLKTIFLLHALIQGDVYYDEDTNKVIEEKNFPTIQIKPHLTKTSSRWTFAETNNWPDCDEGGKILKIIYVNKMNEITYFPTCIVYYQKARQQRDQALDQEPQLQIDTYMVQ